MTPETIDWLARAIGYCVALGLGLLLAAFLLQQGVNAVWKATKNAYTLAQLRKAARQVKCSGEDDDA
jgi:hypothetical protein